MTDSHYKNMHRHLSPSFVTGSRKNMGKWYLWESIQYIRNM